jgi:hypothetical protein
MFDTSKMEHSKSYHQLRVIKWNQFIRDKRYIAIPDIFNKGISEAEKAKKDGSYHSILSRYTMGWIYGIMTSDDEINRELNKEEQTKWYFVNADRLPENWWKLAMRTGKTGVIDEDMPGGGFGVFDPTEDDRRAALYDMLMPAYRAFRENFQARPWYHWFTQHDRYTAERDTMHAIRGIMMTLTGFDRATFDSDYNQYVEHVTGQVKVEEEPQKNEVEKEKVEIDKKDLNNEHNLEVQKPIESNPNLEESIILDDRSEF